MGVLGVNVHGSHLDLFEKSLQHLRHVPIRAYVIERDDIKAQAVSYYIAQQTGQWSTFFESHKETVDYSFTRIKAGENELRSQTARLHDFLEANRFDYKIVKYESFLKDPRLIMGDFVPANRNLSMPKLIRQSDSKKTEMVARYKRDSDDTKSMER